MQLSSLGQRVMKGRGIVTDIPVLSGVALVTDILVLSGVVSVACAAAAPAVQYSLKIFAALVASMRSPQALEAQEYITKLIEADASPIVPHKQVKEFCSGHPIHSAP
jgi:hypothetical protein